MRSGRIHSVVFILTLVCSLATSHALAQAPYFQNKTIKIVRGGEPGGTGDLAGAGADSILKKHIPGEPTIIVENMPGAAGRKAANHIFSTAKPDGLSIGAVGAGLVAGPILGLSGSQYDLDKLIYLGSTESGDPYASSAAKNRVSTAWKNFARRPDCESARKQSATRFTSADGMFAYLLGLKEPRMVVGYGGLGDRCRARKGRSGCPRERRGLPSSSAIAAVEYKDFFIFHASISIPKGNFLRRCPRVRNWRAFAKNDRERQLINLFRTFLYPRWPYIVSAGNAQGSCGDLARRNGEGVQGSGVSHRFQKTDDHRSDAAHRRTGRNRDPRAAARRGNRRAVQKNGRAGAAAGEMN